ncbi:MAG: PQQ-dependent sugar dehydrogenase, partial [Cyclobacteriaceae bacterium]|nr:PQQ-dependent sugar dehydrogenase [Cyclobacteriaceae bacterium]
LFVERRGGVKLYLPEERKTKPLGVLPVYDGYEDGLLGVTHDPDYRNNGWVYMYYSPKGDESIQRLSRFNLTGDSLLFDSEKVMLELHSQREECCHSAGSLTFGPDGLLYLSLGDNSNPLTFTHYDRSHLFAPHDERPGRKNWDAQRTAGNTNDLRGGIIRIKPEPDGSYSIPPGNLFSPDDSLSRPEIYVMGGRNPFRISVDQHTNYLYYGEVGPDTGSDTERGPRGYDEFNQVRQAGYYGWPFFLGDNKPYNRYNWATQELGEAFDPQKPENRSVNNTGRNILPPAMPAMIYYPYEVSDEFPLLGEGGRNAMAGPVYYSDDYPDTRRKFPSYYDGKWFIYEWMRNWIMVVTFDEHDSLKQIEPFLPGIELRSPMDMEFGPDGALYMLEYGTNWFTGNDDARLIRIDYNDKNRLPVAIAQAEKTIGAVPLTVDFSAEQSYDFDKEDELAYSWRIAASGVEIGQGKVVSHTFEKPGIYPVELTVTDSKGESSTTMLEVLAGNERPEVDISIEGNSTFYRDGLAISYSVEVNDREEGSRADGGISADSVNFTINYITPDQGAGSAGGHQINTIPFKKGLDLIAGSDCKSCHQRDQLSVGPAYTAIAQRYAGQKEAIQTLAEKVINGGGGNWGEHSMAAHPQISQDEALQMVQYILAQDNERAGQQPLDGRYAFTEHLKAPGGVYVMKASYTDPGNGPIPGLTGRQEVVLRPLQVEAENCNSYSSVSKERPSSTNYMRVAPLEQGAYIVFNDIDLAGIEAVNIRVSAVSAGGVLEIRGGAVDGSLLTAIDVPATGNDLEWTEVKGVLSQTAPGKQDLFLVFQHKDPAVKERMFFLDWFAFSMKK